MLDNRYCWNKGVTTGEMKSSPWVLGYSYDGKQFNTIVVIVIIITHEYVWENILAYQHISNRHTTNTMYCKLQFEICNLQCIILKYSQRFALKKQIDLFHFLSLAFNVSICFFDNCFFPADRWQKFLAKCAKTKQTLKNFRGYFIWMSR